jgi:putative inorganic carbon (hco3(-)) transporter
MSSSAIAWTREESFWEFLGLLLRPLHLALAFPSILYILAMTVFLFRPPDLFSFYADRIAFVVLVFFVSLRAMAFGERVPFFAGITLPMLGLSVLAVLRALRGPYDAQVWSLVAGKFIVPFVLFHLAVVVFQGPAERRHFEIFSLVVLAYLVFIALAFLLEAKSLIWPRFILDESLGFHPDRARGPFLQAVANGVSLNLLGILAFTLPRNYRRFVWPLGLLLPLAVLATLTRAVWISFGISALAVGFLLVERRLQALCLLLVVGGILAGLAVGFDNHSLEKMLWERTAERGPVQARLAVYKGAWSMIREHPLAGWPPRRMYSELGRRMEGYRLRIFYVHNTYLALLLEFGVPGLALYLILFFNLFRIARHGPKTEPEHLSAIRRLWPVILGVYLFNACFVDMAYQFVIGLLFTVAGMLCASTELPT